MVRWFVRFAAAALVGALLVWFWNRSNEDLLEEELEEEIPLEFEVSAQDVLAPGMLDGNGLMDDAAPAAASASEMAPPEPVATEETPAGLPETEATPPESADAPTETAAEAPAEAEREMLVDVPIASAADAPAEGATPEEVATDADDTDADQELLLDSNAPTPEGAGDNVIAIKGIGPRYSEKLAEMGITTFGALLGTPIDTLAVAFPRVTEAELHNWLEQARELVDQSSEPA